MIHPTRGCGRPGRPAAAVFIICVALLFTGCAGSATPLPARLSHGLHSQPELAERVLQAIAAEDLQALKDLALSGEEFERFVWPELPASRPGTNLTVQSVWGPLYFRSMNQLNETFERFKGKKLRLVSITPRREVSEYAGHRAYSDMRTMLRDEEGKEFDYPLIGTLIEMDGVWKVYSYARYD